MEVIVAENEASDPAKSLVLRGCAGGPAVAMAATGRSAQDQPPPPQGTSRGENFSAKPPAQLFASDCTGAGCHKGPQGLGKGQVPGSLAGFLREHYTNSRESAAALAGYLSKIPSGPEPREARTPRSGKPAATAIAPASALPNWGEGAEPKPAPGEVRRPRADPRWRSIPRGRAGLTRIRPPHRRRRRSPRRRRLSPSAGPGTARPSAGRDSRGAGSAARAGARGGARSAAAPPPPRRSSTTSSTDAARPLGLRRLARPAAASASPSACGLAGCPARRRLPPRPWPPRLRPHPRRPRGGP